MSIQTDTLEVLSSAPRYNQWIFDSFSDHLGPTVLEIGCGIGTFTQLILKTADHVTAVDIVPHYVNRLNEQLTNLPTGKTIRSLCVDVFQEPEVIEENHYDAIVMLNVLEHIEDDHAAIETLMRFLKPGGRLILLVPALMSLYSDYDRSIHHHRRYDQQGLTRVLEKAQLSILFNQYFNFIGIFGWWWNFCIQKKTAMQLNSVSMFNTLCPILRAAETLFPPPVGLSLIAVGQKPN